MSIRTAHARTPSLAALLAATMVLVLAMFASQTAGPKAGALAGLIDRIAVAADAGSFKGLPLEFDPAAPGPRHAIQNRTHKLDPDGFADAESARDIAFGFMAGRHATAASTPAASVAARTTRHADARAPPVSIPSSATL